MLNINVNRKQPPGCIGIYGDVRDNKWNLANVFTTMAFDMAAAAELVGVEKLNIKVNRMFRYN